jgi:hypothetical protein
MSTSGTQAAIGLIGIADQGLPMAIATAEADYSLLVSAGRPGALDALGHVGHIRALAEHGPQQRTANN